MVIHQMHQIQVWVELEDMVVMEEEVIQNIMAGFVVEVEDMVVMEDMGHQPV